MSDPTIGDGDCLVLNRADLVAGFKLWLETWRLTPTEVINAMLADTTDSTVYANTAADTFIEFLIQSAAEPLVDRP